MVVAFVATAQKDKSHEPDSPYFTLARESFRNNDYAAAYDYLGMELAAHPKNGHAWFWKGWLDLYFRNEVPDALNAFDRAVKLVPRKDKEFLASAYSGRGVANRSAGNLNAAYADCTKAIKLAPTPQGYINRGELYYFEGKYVEAGFDFFAALELDSTDRDALYSAGKYYYAIKNYAMCLRWLSDCIAKYPDYSDYYLLKYLCYRDMGEYENAVRFLEEAIKLEDDAAAKDRMTTELNSLYEYLRQNGQSEGEGSVDE